MASYPSRREENEMAGTPRTIRKLAALVAAPSLLLVACGDDSGNPFGDPGNGDADVEAVAPPNFSPTSRYLQTVADKSSGEAYRYEMWMSFGDEADIEDAPVATGEQVSTDQASMAMDMGVIFEAIADQIGQPIPPELSSADMTMEMVMDGTDMYMRMPGMSDLAAQSGAAVGTEAELFEILQDWGYIDLSAMTGTDPEDLQSMAGGTGWDPAALMDALRDVEGARELDATDVRGEAMTGITAEVKYADLLAAQGTDLEELEEVMPGDELESMADLTMEVSVWVDSEGYLGRMSFVMDMEELADASGEPIDPQALGMLGNDMHMTMDFFDYADPGISVDVPTDAPDITEQMGEMMEQA